MVMLSRRSFLMLSAAVPIAAATAALVAPAEPLYVGVDYALTCRDWTCVQWWTRDQHGQVWLRPLPPFVRGFARGDRIGLEVSKDGARWFELVSHDADNRHYIGSPCYMAPFPGSRIPDVEVDELATFTQRDRWRVSRSGTASCAPAASRERTWAEIGWS